MADLSKSEPHGGLVKLLSDVLQVSNARVEAAHPLSGGAIQENWSLDLRHDAGLTSLVLRMDAPSVISESRSRKEEFQVMSAAFAAGVIVPKPILFCDDASVLGQPFAVMEKVTGEGFGPRIVKKTELYADREALAYQLGRELGKIHLIPLNTPGLELLSKERAWTANEAVTSLRADLEVFDTVYPGLELALTWAEANVPRQRESLFLHRDYRTGNYMLSDTGITAVLDWEFASHGDPMSDLGWFTAECWRFSRPELEAGGIGSRAQFYRGYEEVSGHKIDDGAVRFWEVISHVRWAVIALQQGQRHFSGEEKSLDLALTGQIPAHLQMIVMRAISTTATPGQNREVA